MNSAQGIREGKLTHLKNKYPTIFEMITSKTMTEDGFQTIVNHLKQINVDSVQAGKLFGEMCAAECEKNDTCFKLDQLSL